MGDGLTKQLTVAVTEIWGKKGKMEYTKEYGGLMK